MGMHLKTINVTKATKYKRFVPPLSNRHNGDMNYRFPTLVLLVGPQVPVLVPEYAVQVTKKHESTFIHAKYLDPQLATTRVTGLEPLSQSDGTCKFSDTDDYDSWSNRWDYEHNYYERIAYDFRGNSDGSVTFTWCKMWVYRDGHPGSVETMETIWYPLEYTDHGRYVSVPYIKRQGAGDPGVFWSCNASFGNRMTEDIWDSCTTELRQFVSPSAYFLLEEPLWVRGSAELPQQLKALCFEASKSALETIPAYADNNIANLIETFSSVVGLLSQGVQFAWEGAKSLGSLWLAYRYSYSTTKSDTQQAIDAIGRRAFFSYFKDTRIDGDAQANILGADVHVHLRTRCHKRSSDLLSAIRLRLWEYGLLPSKYRLWDLIPFSFVVDWVFNIGNGLQDEDTLSALSHGYSFEDSQYSVKYTVNTDLGPVECYTRWESYPIFWSDYNLHLDGHKPIKIVTHTKRAMDTIALAEGFRR